MGNEMIIWGVMCFLLGIGAAIMIFMLIATLIDREE